MTFQEKVVLARMAEMQLTIEKFDSAVLKQLEQYYKAATKSLLADVKAAKGKSARLWTNTRLIAMLEEAQLVHQTIINEIARQAGQATAEVGVYALQQMNNIISWDGRVKDFNNVSLTQQQLYALATEQPLGDRRLDEWIGSALAPDIDAIKSEIATGYIRGDSYAQVVSRLTNALELSTDKQKRDLESVVKTYTQAMNVAAQQDVYEANQDIVTQVEWTAIMEAGNVKTGRGTCPRCMALDGLRWFTTDYNRPDCPLHVRCRCMLLPVTPTWKELGFDIDEMERVYRPWVIRDDLDDIAEYGFTDQNYAGWWKTRSKAFQDAAVGPVRASMIRSGDIAFNNMVDNKGNLILIKDLVTAPIPYVAPTLYGYTYRGIAASDIFGGGSAGNLGKILSISDNCDE